MGARTGDDGGSVFWFEVPLPAVARPTVEREVVPAGATTRVGEVRRRVLVVEDNVVNQRVARAVLGQFGFDVDIAVNGAEGVRMVDAGGYLAVFMDLQMPVMDGIEATVAIRDQLGSTVPVIALSASVLPEDVARCQASRASLTDPQNGL